MPRQAGDLCEAAAGEQQRTRAIVIYPMTRQSKLDQTVIENAQGLDFIILDELHTYRGRQSRRGDAGAALA